MRTLLKFLVCLYPPAWRNRYGLELDALIDEAPPKWTDAGNLAFAAFSMRLRTAHPAKLMLALAVTGACAGAGIAYYQTPRYESAGEFRLTTSMENTRRQLQHALSRSSLEPVIEAFDLYPNKDAWQRIEKMRRNIVIQSAVNGKLRMAFRHDDPSIAARAGARLEQAMSKAGIEPVKGSFGTVPVPVINKRSAARGMAVGMVLALCTLIIRRLVPAAF